MVLGEVSIEDASGNGLLTISPVNTDDLDGADAESEKTIVRLPGGSDHLCCVAMYLV